MPEPFVPAWWLPGGHLQTVWRRFERIVPIDHDRQRVELDDGDFIDLDWVHAEQQDEKNTVVWVFHGLCGSSRSAYIQTLQARLRDQGYTSIAMNFRGCSGEINRLARAYHSGATTDVNEVFNKVRARNSQRDFSCVGFSLGANVLLKWLAESGSEIPVSKAIAVSTPFKLGPCSQAMQTSIGKFYGRHFLNRLVKDLKSKIKYFETIHNDEQLAILQGLGNPDLLNTLWEFDERITGPLHGFDGAEDYYRRCSSFRFLEDVTTPTLLIQGKNDPLIPATSLPDPQQLNSCISTEFPDGGGHVGFVDGNARDWLNRRILGYLFD